MSRSSATLRSKLILLLLGSMAPLLVMSLSNAWISYRAELERLERSTEAVARGVALGIALEVQRGLAGLNALSLSRPLCAGNVADFRRQVDRFMEVQHPGANLVLSDAAGQQLINLLAPAGEPLPVRRNRELVRESLTGGGALVSNVYAGTFQDRIVTLEVPVHCGGQARYNLALVPRLEVFEAVLLQQLAPAGWSLFLLDAKGEAIASTGSGELPPAAALSLAFDGPQQPGHGGLAGSAGMTVAYSRVADFGWGVLIQRPLDTVNAALARSVLLLLLTGLLLVLFGVAFAVSVARSLVRPMERLSALASNGADEGSTPIPPSGVREIDAVAGRLQDAVRELRLEDQRRNDFIATLAHEMRNPLAPVMNALVMLRRSHGLAPDGERLTDMAQRQLAQLKRLVNDLLEVARLGQGKLSLDLRVTDLREPVKAALENVAGRFEERRQALAVRLPDAPLLVSGDELRLTQVFSNLLDNASKYSLEGGRASIEARASGGRVVVEVSDDGRGLDPGEASRVFEMYWQSGTPPGRGGLGIGLALVKRLAEAHGGGVAARSAGPGRGSTFTVWLPACGVDHEPGAPGREG